jgi:hypothetical protein
MTETTCLSKIILDVIFFAPDIIPAESPRAIIDTKLVFGGATRAISVNCYLSRFKNFQSPNFNTMEVEENLCAQAKN